MVQAEGDPSGIAQVVHGWGKCNLWRCLKDDAAFPGPLGCPQVQVFVLCLEALCKPVTVPEALPNALQCLHYHFPAHFTDE